MRHGPAPADTVKAATPAHHQHQSQDTARSVSDSAAIAAVVEQFHAALAAGDSVAALALLAPDVTILEAGGIETLEEYRAHHLPGDIAFARAVPRSRTPIRVTVAGETAWTTSSGATQGEFRGRAVNSTSAELMVLRRAGERWLIRAIHWSSRPRR
jgi:ketosteroid isomerase-like protein